MNPITMKLVVDDLILQALREDITFEDVSTASVCPTARPAKVELICGTEHINAKSLMNILCVDLAQPIKMVIYAPEKESETYFANFTMYLA